MEDKTYDLIAKLYSEFGEFKTDVNSKLDKLENGQKKIESLIENDLKKDISALYDGYQQTYEKLVTVEKKVDDISTKVDKQEVEIKVIKGGKA
jgi:predicted RNase H-like nuclease (RuvC/YqgF family)